MIIFASTTITRSKRLFQRLRAQQVFEPRESVTGFVDVTFRNGLYLAKTVCH